MIALAAEYRDRDDIASPRLDGMLALRGVIETAESADDSEAAQDDGALLATLDVAIAELVRERQAEGAALAATLTERIEEIAELTRQAEALAPSRQEALGVRLREQVAALVGAGSPVPEDRLATELALLAVKIDVTEEIDRLKSHCAAAARHLQEGGAVGRKLDFLAQEFNREANTLCSKGLSCRAHGGRPGAQGRHRPVPRAGAERGVGGERLHRQFGSWAPRPPAGAVLPFRCGQDDHYPPPGGARRRRSRNLGLAHDAPKRPDEMDGRDYHFVDEAGFARLRERGAFLECAEVFGHWYGTARDPVESALDAGRDVVFDIDWQGSQQLAEAVQGDLVRIFILPPSLEALEQRLKRRAQDTAAVVAERMSRAADEMSHYDEYDYVVINTALERSVKEVRSILRAERLRRDRLRGLDAFVRKLTVSTKPPRG